MSISKSAIKKFEESIASRQKKLAEKKMELRQRLEMRAEVINDNISALELKIASEKSKLVDIQNEINEIGIHD